jgi:hypothetical protein
MKHTFIFLFLLNMSSFTTLDENTSHICLPVEEVACTGEPILCPAGYIDGCLTEETSVHTCVLRYDGPSCEVPMKLNCPANFQDGCETNQTDTHECVPEKGGSCSEGKRFSCPVNFKDACYQ